MHYPRDALLSRQRDAFSPFAPSRLCVRHTPLKPSLILLRCLLRHIFPQARDPRKTPGLKARHVPTRADRALSPAKGDRRPGSHPATQTSAVSAPLPVRIVHPPTPHSRHQIRLHRDIPMRSLRVRAYLVRRMDRLLPHLPLHPRQTHVQPRRQEKSPVAHI